MLLQFGVYSGPYLRHGSGVKKRQCSSPPAEGAEGKEKGSEETLGGSWDPYRRYHGGQERGRKG